MPLENPFTMQIQVFVPKTLRIAESDIKLIIP